MNSAAQLDEYSIERINEEIRAHRRARDAKVREAFAELAVKLVPVEDAGNFEMTEYALRHHVLYESCRGVADGDRARVECAKVLATSSLVAESRACTVSPSGVTLFLWKAQTQQRADGMYDTDPYIVTSLPPRDQRVPAIFREALAQFDESRYRLFFAAGPGIAIILNERERAEAHNSYTLSGLPATIYLDLSASPVRMAESILHESVHCWFNEALAALGEKLAPEVRVYSPWKSAERPVANFLHAVMAFGVLQRYFRDMADSDRVDGWDREYCSIRSGHELDNLRIARRALGSRLDDVQSRDLRRIIRALLA
jgi:HEXXH motif-containing protein